MTYRASTPVPEASPITQGFEAHALAAFSPLPLANKARRRLTAGGD
jgi:hypothetical protein